MATKENALSLVNKAFNQAIKNGEKITEMTVAVLKNRLLNITNRKFDPKEYGVNSMRDFIEWLSPEVEFVDKRPHPIVRVQSSVFDSHPQPQPFIENNILPAEDATSSESHLLQKTHETKRIRRDLWAAIMDYASGRIYIWDDVQEIARPAEENDVENFRLMPTITAETLADWRSSFFAEHRQGNTGVDLVDLQRWQELGLSTNFLPRKLQMPWNRQLTVRVREALHNFFSQPAPKVIVATDLSPEPKTANVSEHMLDDSLDSARIRGDGFAVGELLAKQTDAQPDLLSESILAQIIGAWAGQHGVMLEPKSLSDLAGIADSFSRDNLTTAFVNAIRRLNAFDSDLNDSIRDFAFRIRDDLSQVYGIESKSPSDMCRAALSNLDAIISEGRNAVTRFLRTTPATAKIASIELLRISHRLRPLLIADERHFLGDLEILIGPAFRKLCEAYERNEDAEVVRRAPEYLSNIRAHRPSGTDSRLKSYIWLMLVKPVLDHLIIVVEEAVSRGETALAPFLSLRNPETKADLRAAGKEIYLSFSLLNQGAGQAKEIYLNKITSNQGISLELVEPTELFEIPANGEQLVKLQLILSSPQEIVDIPIEWVCQTSLGNQTSFLNKLSISQQVTEPDWDALLESPPYTLNPIKRPDRLYGRKSVLHKLRLAAMAGTSTFIWGQKRIGKTSVLQVLVALLSEHKDTTCILLRMGELASLHEGQLARLIAERLMKGLKTTFTLPDEAEFGAGLGKLIYLTEQLLVEFPHRKFIVIIDEFDDLDSSFYTGERGKQFVKALRSLSEVGLTFFFVGSERMNAIYSRHQADLNKWTNIRLDKIDSRLDCQSLIMEPVAGAIEYGAGAIDFIIDYTSSNPFYIHNFCYQVFERCLSEHRTFVDINDAQAVRQQLLKALGPTNFSHFWEDNPVLDNQEKRKQSAENCVALSCIAVLGGRFESFEEIFEAQEALPLAPEDRANSTDLRNACHRLIVREILQQRSNSEGYVVHLQIFRDWLGENAASKLVPIWVDYLSQMRKDLDKERDVSLAVEPQDNNNFPITEDDMLAVAQRLIFCGRQKDVAEIKAWLRQFDDDSRIEIAFSLLRRLAERGFINEGLRALGLQKIEEMIQGKRQELGDRAWKIIKSRSDNLAIAYVDSDHKSGASTAREIQKMMRPGKCSHSSDLDGWMRSHLEQDPMIAIVDDFSGTGSTLIKGLRKCRDKISIELWNQYIVDGRIFLFVMYAFPEALTAIREEFPGLHVSAATVLGDELRACDEESQIFETDAERKFAEEVLQQIGRELCPSAPVGYGDQGALLVFHNAAPNNTLPIFWSGGSVGERPWKPLFPRA